MTVSISTAVRNAELDAITTGVGASGLLRIYDATGGVPASANTALTTQVLLAELACSATFAPAASAGVLTASAISNDASANATGTAAFYRLTTSGGTCVIQGTAGTSGTLNPTILSSKGDLGLPWAPGATLGWRPAQKARQHGLP